MRKFLISFIAIVLPLLVCCQGSIDIEQEEAAIKAVIEKETNAARAYGYDSWASLIEDWESCYVQDESYVRFWAGKNNYNVFRGWDELANPETIDSLRNIAEPPVPAEFRTEYEDYKIKVYPESAWAVYNQVHYSNEGELLNTFPSVRFLEKVDGEWKMVFQSWINAGSYEVVEEEETE